MFQLQEFLEGRQRLMFLDIESVGLHGEAFAFGYQVCVCRNNEIGPVAELAAHCNFESLDKSSASSPEDWQWVKDNVPAQLERSPEFFTPLALRGFFWEYWQKERRVGTAIVADVAWPVEANFLRQCVLDHPAERKWEGPYPLLDSATVLWAAGMDPLKLYPRQKGEEKQHDPLHDARQSARLFMEAVRKLKGLPTPA